MEKRVRRIVYRSLRNLGVEKVYHSISRVDAFSSYSVEIGENNLPIGRRFKADVLNALKGNHQFTSQELCNNS